MPFLIVKCKNPNCKATPVTPYYSSLMKPEQIRSKLIGCSPIQISCQECGHVDTYSQDDYHIAAGQTIEVK